MTNYTKAHLLREEKITYQTTYHWVHYFSLQGLLSFFIIPLIQSYADEFVITNKRVIVKKGLFAIWTFEMTLKKIETVKVEQSISGRLLGYGSLTFIGSGGTKEKLEYIKDPIRFRKAFMEADINNN
jgi:uncharacterized membrane protein YdbT with pleckstrin-like domain